MPRAFDFAFQIHLNESVSKHLCMHASVLTYPKLPGATWQFYGSSSRPRCKISNLFVHDDGRHVRDRLEKQNHVNNKGDSSIDPTIIISHLHDVEFH
jgi:hypothetical protein